MREMTELVRENLCKAQQRQKRNYDRGTRERGINVGDEVLVLLPDPQNRLKLGWVGPFDVTKQVSKVDYEVATPGKRDTRKVYHVNMLKKWHQPVETEVAADFLALTEVSTGKQKESDLLGDAGILVVLEPLEEPEETPSDVHALTETQRESLERSLQEFSKLFREQPGRTSVVSHTIHAEGAVPIRQRAYRVPY